MPAWNIAVTTFAGVALLRLTSTRGVSCSPSWIKNVSRVYGGQATRQLSQRQPMSHGGHYTYKYPRPSVTVDTLIFTVEESSVWLLLIKRKNGPFKDHWALPGGFVDQNEALDLAAARELEEETGLTEIPLAQIGAFGDPGRDPRGHTITVAYVAWVASRSCGVKAGDDAAEAEWFALGSLPPLAFDHAKIIDVAWKRIMVINAPESTTGSTIIEKGSGQELHELSDTKDAHVVANTRPLALRR